MAEESFDDVLTGMKQQPQSPAVAANPTASPEQGVTPQGQVSPELHNVLGDVKQMANPDAGVEPQQSDLTEDQIQQSMQKKRELQANLKDAFGFVDNNLANRTAAAMGHSVLEGVNHMFFEWGDTPLTKEQEEALPINGESAWRNSANIVVRTLLQRTVNNFDTLLQKPLEPMSIGFSTAIAGLRQAGSDTGFKPAENLADIMSDPAMIAIFHQTGAITPSEDAIREYVTKPPLPQEVIRAVKNGVFPEAPVEMKAEAAQYTEPKAANQNIDFDKQIADLHEQMKSDPQKAAVYQEQIERLNEQRESLAEKTAPAQDIHHLAAQIDPEAVAQSRTAEARQQLLRDGIAKAKEEQVAQAEANAPHNDEIASLQKTLEEGSKRQQKIAQAKIDDLTRKNKAWISEQTAEDTEEIQKMRQGIQSLHEVRADYATRLSAAYREAASRMPKVAEAPKLTEEAAVAEEKKEPLAAERVKTPDEVKTTDDNHKAIVDDIVKRATAKGYGEEEARASAELIARQYRYLADMYQGAKGSALELYKKEGAGIVGQGEKWAKSKVLSSGTKGQYNAAQRMIRLMKSADASTLIHESAHHFLAMMKRFEAEDGAPEGLKADMQTIRQWLGVKDDGIFTRKMEEKFATGFERYVMEGHAPAKELIPIFQKFEKWLTAIYQTVKGIPNQGGGITPAIRDFFDKTIEPDAERRDNPRQTAVAPENTEIFRTPVGGKVKENAVNMRIPKEPMSLAEWVNENGGLKDTQGDIAEIAKDWHLDRNGKTIRGRKSLVREDGMDIDDAALRAHEAGYFPDIAGERPTINEFQEKLREDVSGNKQYSLHDEKALADYNTAMEHNAEVDRISNEFGISAEGKTRAEFWAEAKEKMSHAEWERTMFDMEDSARAEIEDAEREAKKFMESRGEAWEPEEVKTRTLEDLENEREQESDAGNTQSGVSGTQKSRLAAGGANEVQEGSGEVAGGAGNAGSRGETTEPRGISPVPKAIPGEKPIIGTDGRIDTSLSDKLGSSEFLRRYNAELLRNERNGKLAKQFSFEDTVKLADMRNAAEQMGMSVDQMMQIQTDYGSMTERPILRAGAYILMKQMHEEMILAAKDAIASGQAKDMADFLRTYEKREELLNAYKTTESLSKEAGVHLVASKIIEAIDITGAKATGDILYQMEKMEKEGKASGNGLSEADLKKMRELANSIGSMDDSRDVANMLEKVNKPTFWDKILEWRMVSLISGLTTHASYFIGGIPLNFYKSVVEDTLTASVDKARAALGLANAGDEFSQGFKGLLYQIRRLPNTLSVTGTAIRTGKTVLLPHETFESTSQLFDNIKKTTGINPEALKTVVDNSFREENFADLKPLRQEINDAKALGDDTHANALQTKMDVEVARKKAEITKVVLAEMQSRAKTWADVYDTTKDFILSQSSALKHLMQDESSGSTTNPVAAALKQEAKMVYSSIHTFQRYSLAYGEIPAECRRAAIAEDKALQEGGSAPKSMKEIELRTQEMMKNPPPEVMAKVTKQANDLSFMNNNSEYAKSLNRFLDEMNLGGAPIGKIIAPITTVPTNIAVELMKRTPVGGLLIESVRKDLSGANGITAQNKAIARQLGGLGLIALGYSLAHYGLATPSSSIDYKHEQERRDAGKQSNSVRIGDWMVNLSSMPILSNLITLGADLHHIKDTALGDDESDTLRAAAYSAVKNFALHENALTNLADAMDAVTGKGSVLNYFENQASSFVVPALINQSNQDPYQREAKTLLDKIKSRIGGESEDLSPKINALTGEPIVREKAYIPGTKFAQASATPDVIANALMQLHIYPANPKPTINGVDLHPKQAAEYSSVKGHLLHSGLQMLIEGDGATDFATADKDDKRKMINKIERHAANCAKSYMFGKYPELLKEANDKYEASCEGEDFNYSPYNPQ